MYTVFLCKLSDRKLDIKKYSKYVHFEVCQFWHSGRLTNFVLNRYESGQNETKTGTMIINYLRNNIP